jgi:(1->4)-alpha-D-glucan 1-alpha-D-glucosylmutase
LLSGLEALAAAPRERMANGVRALLDTPSDGRAKLWIVYRALGLRRADPVLFAQGDYAPLAVQGARARHALAFARRLDERGIVVVAGRLFASLGPAVDEPPVGEDAWKDTLLDVGFLRAGIVVTDVLTDRSFTVDARAVPLGRVLSHFPAALLSYRTSG